MIPDKRSNGSECYEYIFLFTNDVLVVSKNVERLVQRDILQYFILEEELIVLPNIYLLGSVSKV